MHLNVTGNRNTFFGAESGFRNVNGLDNTFVGSQADYSNLSGNENTLVVYGLLAVLQKTMLTTYKIRDQGLRLV